jgi:signal transduction histidine kinase
MALYALGLKQKAQCAFGIVFLCVLLSLLAQLGTGYELRGVVGELRESARKLVALYEFKTRVYRQVKELPDYLTGHDADAKEEYQAFERQSQSSLDALAALVRPGSEKEAFTAVEDAYRRLGSVGDRILGSFEKNDTSQALRLMEKDLEEQTLPAFDRALEHLQEAFYVKSFHRAVVAADQTGTRGFAVVSTVVLLVLAATLWVSLWIERELTDPLGKLVEAARQMGRGNLDYRCSLRSHGELEQLARALWEMAERLKEYQKRLIEKERLATLGVVAAGLAHAVRNPLASIRALAQVALLDPLDRESLKESLREIIAEVDRLDGRVGELLRWSDPGKRWPKWVAVPELFKELRARLHRALRPGLRLELELEKDLPLLWVDRQRIEAALEELVRNALRACGNEGVIVLRSRLCQGKGSKELLIEVEDNGCGICAQEKNRVLELFYTTRSDGTGLGLPFAAKLVEWEGGHLSFTARPAKGPLCA